MLRKLITCALVATSAALVAATPASAATGTWTLSDASTTQSGYAAIDGSDAANAWAVGTAGIPRPYVKRWNGTHWAVMPTPAFAKRASYIGLTRVSTLAQSNTWASGGAMVDRDDAAVIAHWFQGRWYTRVLPVGSQIQHLSVFSASNVWFLGATRDRAGLHPVYWHWNGRTWSSGTLPALVERGSDDAYYSAAQTVTSDHSAVLLRYSAGRWVLDRGPQVTLRKGAHGYFFTGAVRRAAGDVIVSVAYEANEGLSPGTDLYRWNGRAWSHFWGSATGTAYTICGDGSGGVWFLDQGTSAGARMRDIVGEQVGLLARTVAVPRFAQGQLQIEDITLRPGTRILWTAGETFTDQNAAPRAAVGSYRS